LEVEVMHIILMGPPGAGKGTQAALLSQREVIPHISTGEIFRGHMAKGTPLGQLAKGYVDGGKYVPDDVTNAMVKDRLSQDDCKRGFILDGYPRTTAQAQALEVMCAELGLHLDGVVKIEIPEALLVERAEGRRVCRNCGATYHVKFNPPQVAGVCDKCGGELYQRSDDSGSMVSIRLKEYHDKTADVLAYYRGRGMVRFVDGDQPVDAVTAAIKEAVVGAR
jgi:adenylate kinase